MICTTLPVVRRARCVGAHDQRRLRAAMRAVRHLGRPRLVACHAPPPAQCTPARSCGCFFTPNTQPHTHSHAHTRTQPRTQRHAHSATHTQPHTHTHSATHTHTRGVLDELLHLPQRAAHHKLRARAGEAAAAAAAAAGCVSARAWLGVRRQRRVTRPHPGQHARTQAGHHRARGWEHPTW
jgi:hypothetical protein